MKLRSALTINGRTYPEGTEVGWMRIYPFFLVHMLAFGLSGFAMAYGARDTDEIFLYAHGGFAITAYVVFYVSIFGADEVKWMFINAALGIAGIYSQLEWMLGRFGKHINDVPWHVHVVPFTYYVLYVFLIRQAFLDLFAARGCRAARHRREVLRDHLAGHLRGFLAARPSLVVLDLLFRPQARYHFDVDAIR